MAAFGGKGCGSLELTIAEASQLRARLDQHGGGGGALRQLLAELALQAGQAGVDLPDLGLGCGIERGSDHEFARTEFDARGLRRCP